MTLAIQKITKEGRSFIWELFWCRFRNKRANLLLNY